MFPELVLAVSPVQVLHAWDERRAAAWAAADVAALRDLYVPGSAAGRVDCGMLRAWRDRGLRVEGMQMQLFSVGVRRRTPDLLVLDVVDRLVGVADVPTDLPTEHVITMRVIDGEWRVATVS